MTLSRTGAWILALSPLSYLAVIAASIPLVPLLIPGMGLLSELTRAEADAAGWVWVVLQITTLVPIVIPVGLILVASSLRARTRLWAIATLVLSALAIIGAVVGVALQIAALGFTDPTIGTDGRYLVGTTLVSDIALVLTATICLCVALRRAGILGASAWVIAGIAAAALVYDLASWPLGLVFPPGVVTFIVWLPLGILLLSARTRPKEASA